MILSEPAVFSPRRAFRFLMAATGIAAVFAALAVIQPGKCDKITALVFALVDVVDIDVAKLLQLLGQLRIHAYDYATGFPGCRRLIRLIQSQPQGGTASAKAEKSNIEGLSFGLVGFEKLRKH
jgi:hypothetical protein